ncbi:mechanosensitive ion channel family protein [Balneola sp. MJW-20]|uniref:mechanosensitive ion channel family protein n=1 Tax=Gracilimonas aurantiaca TaxID=3234185 RepID=UPI003465D0D8
MNDLISQYIPEIYQLPLIIGVIIALTIITASVVSRLFKVLVVKYREQNDESGLTSMLFLRRSIVVLIYIAGFSFAIYMIPQFRVIAGSLLAGAGLLAVAVGFASQQALSNIIGGLFIVIFKPYKITDRIQVRTDLVGVVEDINLRHTVIRNFENKRIIIPNSVISNEVLINSNYEDDKICKWIDLSISYDSDIDLAKEIMAQEVLSHKYSIDVRSEDDIEAGVPRVPVRVVMLSDFSVNLRAWAWADDPPKAFELGCDLLESIKKEFDAQGIEIPFPYRTIVQKSDLTRDKKDREERASS